MQIIKDLRDGLFDALVGINLLREGLDIPEVSLVTILDADKEGFLRSETSLIQTCGRAARNVKGRVILYADHITKSIDACLATTLRRRALQEEYNRLHHITPKTTTRKHQDLFLTTDKPPKSQKALTKDLRSLEAAMRKAAKELNFEEAARLRDRLKTLRNLEVFDT